jgi:hypothetical protein
VDPYHPGNAKWLINHRVDSDYIGKFLPEVVGAADPVLIAGWTVLASKLPLLAPHHIEAPAAN